MPNMISFEGNDGSGKGVQFTLMGERLEEAGREVLSLSFPYLDSETGEAIRARLMGSSPIDPYEMAKLYADNRFEQKPAIVSALARGVFVLTDRWVDSNKTFLPELLETDAQKLSMTRWIEDMEYRRSRMPRPDLTIVLAVDSKVARANMLKRGEASELDVLEQNTGLQEKVVAAYDALCDANPSTYARIDCVDTRTGNMRDKGVIHAEAWAAVERIWGEIKKP